MRDVARKSSRTPRGLALGAVAWCVASLACAGQERSGPWKGTGVADGTGPAGSVAANGDIGQGARRHADHLHLDLADIERRIRAFMEKADVPGASVGIVHGDSLVYSSTFGVKNVETGEPVTPETLFQIGSITKVFTATLLAILRDEGLVELDDPVTKYLPEHVSFPVLKRGGAPQVTLRHLATHTSGLPRDFANRVDLHGPGRVMRPYNVSDLYVGLADTDLAAPVGREWSYSNMGFGILGHALERAAGVPYEDLLRERLLRPLQMCNTRIHLSEEDLRRLASHHWPSDTPRIPRPRWVFGELASFGGLSSTVTDLARFLSLQFRAGESEVEPVDGGSLLELQTPQRLFQGWERGIGFGWWIRRSPELGTIISHGGEVDGHSSYVAFAPDHRVGVIALANLGGSTAGALGEWLLARTVEGAREARKPTPAEAERFFQDRDWGNAAWAYGYLAAQDPDHGEVQYRLGSALFELRRYGEAAGAFQSAARLGYERPFSFYELARIAAILDEPDDALHWLQRAREAGFDNLFRIGTEGDFRALREDHRFGALLEPR